jgi:WD40 repeat protein/serine/threonine protein kinase
MNAAPDPAKAIFLEAVENHAPEQWPAFLDAACTGQPELRREVEALLEAHGDAGTAAQPEPAERAAPRSDAGPRKGTVIGPYKLLEPIGEGGMGAVWMAQQTEPVKRVVALKLIKAGMDSKQVIARFEAERQALALMDHINIAKVFDGGTTASGLPYFVMELVKGVPLTKYCDEHRLTPKHRLELFVPVCQAIQHAHQKGIIHRDIKPSNVLVALYDGKPVPKVIDFGIAKATGQQLTDRTLVTGFGAVVGTLEYMSPEQAEVNQLDIDTRSDIYSLGVMLYELLTGTTPLEKKRLATGAMLEVLRLIREEEPPRPSMRLSESKQSLPSISAQRQTEPAKLTKLVRGELDWIVMKALDKDRNRRYETANSFALDIQRYLADEPVQACPPTVGYRLRKFVRRNKAWVGMATLMATVLLLATAVSATLAIWAREAEGIAREERSNAETLARTEAAARTQATERAEDLARRVYIYRVNLAHREALADNVAQADALIGDCDPARRGWEWAYTKHLCHLEAMTLGGFTDHAAAATAARGAVLGVAYSPDGNRIATAHRNGAVVIWDTRTGREVRALTGHAGPANCVIFDAQGGRVISCGDDRTIRVWDAHTGEPKLLLRGHTEPVFTVALRPGTDEVASSVESPWEKFESGFEIKQWDLAAGKEIRTLHHRGGWDQTNLAFSPDGRRLLSTAFWGRRLRIWDPETGREVEERPLADPNCGLAVSRADGRIAFGTSGTTVGFTPPALGAGMTSCAGHNGTVIAVAFSPDGRRLASASADATIKVWNTADGQQMYHFRGHTGAVTAVAFSPDGGTVVSASVDGTVKVWNVPATPDPFPMRTEGWGYRVRFALHGGRVAISQFGGVTVLDAANNQLAFKIAPSTKPGGSHGLAYSRDGRLIATCTEFSGQIRVWDGATGQPVVAWPGHPGKVRTVAFGTGHLLATAGDDGTVRLWEATTGRPGPVLRAHEGGAFAVAFDPTGATLATLGWDGAVRLWDAATGRLMRQVGTTVQHMSHSFGDALAFDADGRRLAAAGADGTVHVWDLATGAEVFTLRGHTKVVNGVAFSPDGKRLLTGGLDHTLKLWDAATGEEVFTLRGHTGAVLGFAFSLDGHRILSTGTDTTVRAWDAAPQKQ